ncbi:MAG: hypothetical protein IH600_01515 [Bacteroidetes bacterium]|nr:hypothetical protein [Bacteroidota bacterium]
MGLSLTVTHGFPRSAAFTYGVFLVDITMAALAVSAAASATDLYLRAVHSHPALLPTVKTVLVLLFCGYGVYLLLRTPAMLRDRMSVTAGGGFIRRRGSIASAPLHPFTLGVSLKASTVVSPSFLAGFALLTAQAGALGLAGWGMPERLLFAFGFGLGNLLYLQCCMRIAARCTDRLSDSHLRRVQRGFGLAFLVLGVVLLFLLLDELLF